jgi:hypothetical protein
VNEQQLADLFSKQVDRLLGGESVARPADHEGLHELLSLAQDLSQVQFQASPAGQVAFQGQLDAWFGPATAPTTPRLKHGRWDMLSGKLIVLIISIAVTLVTTLATIIVAVVVIVRGVISGPPPQTPVPALTATPIVTTQPALTAPVAPTDMLTPTVTVSPTLPSTIDTIEGITVVVTVELEVGDLVPGLPPGDEGDDDEHGDNPCCGDHDRGHGNDPDHHDEDNPGNSHH